MKISFLISLQIDSEDRLSNLKISTDNLSYYFPESEIIISEIDSVSKLPEEFKKYKHIFTEDSTFFSKTRAYNIAAKNANNDIICLYDADIILKNTVINKCYDILCHKNQDIFYPYNGYFYDIPKKYHNFILEQKNLDSVDINECTLLSDRSVGGVVFFKKNVFFQGGGANENIKIGYEDNEFYERFKKLGYTIGRLNCPIFHLTHVRKETSFDYNPYKDVFEKEFYRICSLTKENLLEEIKNWKYES
jgi:hypothetical protein